MTDRDFYSIGEVLALLLDEFPDVTISKIRFLESQGLIEPERTPSGYRKFTDEEVERLRFILREQRQNYLPLRVIKTRLDDTSDVSRDDSLSMAGDRTGEHTRDIDVPETVTAAHPAARASIPRVPTGGMVRPASAHGDVEQDIPRGAVQESARREARRHADQTESIPRDQLLRQIHIDAALLTELERAGLVGGHDVGDTTFFDAHSIEVAEVAARFHELGIDARHLRAWKTSSDRELSLFEQRILPLLRQRNPASRDEALAMLGEFVELGARLRNSLLAREMQRLSEQR